MPALSPRGFAHPGFVIIGAEHYTCMVTNMSLTGATLIFDAPIDLPQDFLIQLTRDGRVSRRCSLTWADGREAGVLFAAERPAR